MTARLATLLTQICLNNVMSTASPLSNRKGVGDAVISTSTESELCFSEMAFVNGKFELQLI